MSEENFIDTAKKELYTIKAPNSLSQDMLRQWDTNTPYNMELARVIHSWNMTMSTFKRGEYDDRGRCIKPSYREALQDVIWEVPTLFRGVDWKAQEYAIRAEGMQIQKEQELAKKKNILSIFGFGGNGNSDSK